MVYEKILNISYLRKADTLCPSSITVPFSLCSQCTAAGHLQGGPRCSVELSPLNEEGVEL